MYVIVCGVNWYLSVNVQIRSLVTDVDMPPGDISLDIDEVYNRVLVCMLQCIMLGDIGYRGHTRTCE